ncbi:MAG: alpha/beta hydrolase [Gemmataceae bacterium]|mgnify:CR=1 FL=1
MAGYVMFDVRRRLGIGWIRWVIVVSIAYVGVVIMLSLLENWLVYHPCPATAHWRPPEGLEVQDVWLALPTGERIHGWWAPRSQARWAVLYLHGNAGNLSHRQPAIRAWHAHAQASVLIVDYPGYGRSSGKPSESACYDTGRAGYRWLVGEAGIAPEQVILFGKSLGGAIAAHVAMEHPHKALVLHSTFTSLPDIAQEMFPILPARWLVRHRMNTLEKVERYEGLLYIAHGDRDAIVPFHHGERLYVAAARCQRKYFQRLTGADHNDPSGPEFFSGVRAFLEVLAGTPSTGSP